VKLDGMPVILATRIMVQASLDIKVRPYLKKKKTKTKTKNNQSKKGWRCGSSGRAPESMKP
jgi:hypothetical protein